MSKARTILGVDGGGSKTYAVIVDEYGTKLGSGVAGSGNHQGPGVDVALRHIQEACFAALREAGLKPEEISFCQFGLAGADREHDFSILRPALATLPFPHWDVVCDTMEGLRTGSPDNVGVVLVCGSGTNAMGRSKVGNMVQTGGFGYLFGDTAGGYFLAMETFRAAVRSWEYREGPSMLPNMVATHLGFRDMEQVFHHYLDEELNEVPPELTMVLHEAARLGDALSIQVLTQTGRELGNAANSVIRRLGGIENFGGSDIPVVLVGSVLQKGRSPHLLGALQDTVSLANKEARFIIPEMAPVYGAIMLGMDYLQLPVSDDLTVKFTAYGGYV